MKRLFYLNMKFRYYTDNYTHGDDTIQVTIHTATSNYISLFYYRLILNVGYHLINLQKQTYNIFGGLTKQKS